MTSTYIKKPIKVEAIHWGTDDMNHLPDWFRDAIIDDVLEYDLNSPDDKTELYVNTLEGRMHVSYGDYLIRGIKGELYACNSEIFNETYEKVA